MEEAPKFITVVCTGNVCRSPMAARLLAHALAAEEEPLRSMQVVSAGVSAYSGDPASRNACKAMESVGLDLKNHRSQPLTSELTENSGLILAMTADHLQAIRTRFPDLSVPAFRFREWIPSGSRDVNDPFGGPLDLYVETRDNLAEAIPSIIEFLKKEYCQ